jgi:hypothetical protein
MQIFSDACIVLDLTGSQPGRGLLGRTTNPQCCHPPYSHPRHQFAGQAVHAADPVDALYLPASHAVEMYIRIQ